MRELGIDTRGEVITREGESCECTRAVHNALRGKRLVIPDHRLQAYERTNERNAEPLRPIREAAGMVCSMPRSPPR
jgi:hypothetical protein